ncbi:PAS domain S-box-containing protein [Methylobacterium sp. ap11]|uniref:PAS domain-containing protein n=1 Tax=Methylobacterium sp. ap11 TaxID=1761799 RepID=UPI0008C589EA|nr:PAS domain-containing protein [Methylobacterium sp. ap11]SEP49940.1 PAS domain S-box-containing protein [Methylobacterium sp. ap11]
MSELEREGGIPGGPQRTLAFADRDWLRLLEAHGLTGTWTWTFATDEQTWSPGLFRLLGLEPGAARPGGDLFFNLVHPDDRALIEGGAQAMRDGIVTNYLFRIIRSDGSVRVLSSHGTVYFTLDGRPRTAAGVLMDVTDPEHMAALHREEQRRRRILFEQAQTWQHASPYTRSFRLASREVLSLTGLSQQDFHENWTRIFVPEDRARALATMEAVIPTGRPFSAEYALALAGGGSARIRSVFVPVRGDDGRIESWASLNCRVGGFRPAASGAVRQGLEQAVQASHLRAARGLLGWSMGDLAGASGLSLSTVRRLEEDGEGPAARSRHAAVAALRRAGIGFLLVEGNTLAVAKVR